MKLKDDKSLQVKIALEAFKKNKASNPNNIYLTEEDFSYPSTKFIPEDSQYFYKNIGVAEANDFHKAIERAKDSKAPYYFGVQIERDFALMIVEKYDALDEINRKKISEQIATYDVHNNRMMHQDDIGYLLMEGLNLFDLAQKKFKIPFIQEVYELLGQDKNQLKVIFTTWAHCGGWGGIILYGKNQSCDGGGMHGHFHEIEYKGRSYEYSSNYYGHLESHHLYDHIAKYR